MAINFNGTNIDKVIYNGVELDKVIYNGVVVYEPLSLNNSYFYIQNTTDSAIKFNIKLSIKSVPIQVFYYRTGEGYTRPTEPSNTLTSVASSRKLTFQLNAHTTAVIEFIGGQWEYASDRTPLFYDHKELITKAIIGSNCTNAYYQFNNSGYYDNLEEIIYAAAEGSPFGVVNCPKLTTLAFKTTPKYFNQINDIGISEITFPASITRAPSIRDCPNLTVIHNYCNVGVGNYAFAYNPVLEHIYMHNYNPSSNIMINSTGNGWVVDCNPNVVIHLPKAIGDITAARTKFGQYFNYINSTTQATVLFDL
jgi:hypothetical protein